MRRTALILATLTAEAGRLPGQQLPVTPGDHVRIEAKRSSARGALEGTILAVHGGSLVLALSNVADTAIVAFATIEQLAVRRTSPIAHAVLRNAALGLVVGAATGAVAGPVLLSRSCLTWKRDLANQANCAEDLLDNGNRARAAVIFGSAGVGLGALVGILTGRERWQELDARGWQLATVPLPGQIAFRVSTRF
jgi:hypothetical protein